MILFSRASTATSVRHLSSLLPSFGRAVTLKAAACAIVSLACLAQTGCVIGRRTVPLNVPESTAGTQAAAAKGEFFVGAIADNRHFEDKPSEPFTPSIDGNVADMSAEQKITMIGRQRNGYGHAMGDVALPADDSVVKLTRGLLEQALKRRGYQISANEAVPNSATVSIDQFWGWFSPGFASISFEARIVCTIKIMKAGTPRELVVMGYGHNRGEMASDANWQKTYQIAFDDFLSKLDGELAGAGL